MSDVSRVEEVFLAAVGKTDPTDRAGYLNEACAADAELRQQVEVLLAAQPKIGQFLEPADHATYLFVSPRPETESATPGTLVAGRYKLLERIGVNQKGTGPYMSYMDLSLYPFPRTWGRLLLEWHQIFA